MLASPLFMITFSVISSFKFEQLNAIAREFV